MNLDPFFIEVISEYIMVPLSERLHRLYEDEIPEVVEGLKLRLSQLLERSEEQLHGEIAFRALYRLTRKRSGRPKYPEFDWDFIQYYVNNVPPIREAS